jgi:hypothetical protein
MELTVGILIRFGEKIDTEHWAVCDASNSNTNFTKDVHN